MKTIKLIDIWERITKGEKPPKKILLMGTILKYDEDLKTYIDEIEREPIDGIFNLWEVFKDEVEIIEDVSKVQVEMTQEEYNEYLDRKLNTPKEDKKIEKLDLSDWWEITSDEDCKPEMLAKIFNKNAKSFSSKINEIIDKINGEDK